MAGERTVPGIGLKAFYDLGSEWKDGMDTNLQTLSALTQLSVKSRAVDITDGGFTPADGDIYLVPSGAASNANEIAIRDAGSWFYLTPKEGFFAYVEDEAIRYNYTGALWEEFVSAGSGGGGDTTVISSYHGAIVVLDADKTGVNLAPGNVSFDSALADTDGFFDPLVDDEVLVIPAGVTKIRLSANIGVDGTLQTSGSSAIYFTKNGSRNFIGVGVDGGRTEFNNILPSISSGVIPVEEGDEFAFRVNYTGETSEDILSSSTYMSLEVLEGSVLAQGTLASTAPARAFRYTLASDYTPSTGLPTDVVEFDTQEFDTDGDYDTATGRYTLPDDLAGSIMEFTFGTRTTTTGDYTTYIRVYDSSDTLIAESQFGVGETRRVNTSGPVEMPAGSYAEAHFFTNVGLTLEAVPATFFSGKVIAGVVAGSPAATVVSTKTANYTLTLADDNDYVRMNLAAANTLTVPDEATEAFPVGAQVALRQVGAGQTTVVAASGVTVNTSETLNLRKQHSTATLIKVGADEWDLTGDLEAA